MAKTVDIRFQATANFAVRIEITDEQHEKLKRLCDENETPTLFEGDELHTLLLKENTLQPDEFDYIDRDVELEDIEFDDVPSA